MEKYTIKNDHITLEAAPEIFSYAVTLADGSRWEMKRKPYIKYGDGRIVSFPAPREVSVKNAGTADIIRAVFEDFENPEMKIITQVFADRTTGDVIFKIFVSGDKKHEIDHIQYPGPVEFGAEPGHGYTVLSQMQGTMYPAGMQIVAETGLVYERDGYMPIYGQVRDGSGYAAIYETPYDVRYRVDEDRILPLWVNSLGAFRYMRSVRYCFRTDCDYNKIAKCYRSYLKERGRLVTLKEKILRNPNVEKMIGVPVIHAGIASHTSPESMFYDKEHPERNDWYTTFDSQAKLLRELKAKGLEHAYTHFDGWGKHGYDNLHPNPFPPHEKAGGAAGMARLSDTCREIGYIFGIHDQYRDYYFDSPDFCIDDAVLRADGSHQVYKVWAGGAQTFLCSLFQPDYVRRNYEMFKKLGINIDAAYLDVFSVVELDECYNPDHPATRSDCAKNRRHCFDMLTDMGIIPSSEEALDCIIPSLVLCHHAPFHTTKLDSDVDAVGVPIPLLNLVYHDCFIVPWIGLPEKRGGWCIPNSDSAYTYAILYGQPVYCPIDADEKDIKDVKVACESAGKLFHEELVRHEFVDNNYRVQRTTFSDGTVITADLDSGRFEIAHK
ncbi:MAG: hypothetical protein J5950_01975 [Clostridia bacterium]|nr:hypothetical protein [Clostridia bacterium]